MSCRRRGARSAHGRLRRRAEPDAPGERPLAGVKVLDFTAFWAGPFATAWLYAMGADVIKVEAVQRPDGIRFSAAVRPRDDPQFYELSPLFHATNLGKRGITLDLGQPDGLAIAKQARRGLRRDRREFHAAGDGPVRARLGHGARNQPGRRLPAHARLRVVGPVA